jgi:putative phosphotransacetylase
LGPARGSTQVELSATDGVVLGINLPLRVSGDLAGTPGIHLIGPAGAVKLEHGCIVARRHIHAHPDDATRLGIQDGQKVYARFVGARSLIFDEVVVRISDQFQTELHLDTDEGNAASIRPGDYVEVIANLCQDICEKQSCPISSSLASGQGKPFCDLTINNPKLQSFS